MNTASAELVQLNTPQVAELRLNTANMLDEAKALVIDSQEMYELGAETVKVIKSMAKTVEDRRTSITKPLNEALKATNDHFRPFSEALQQAESTLKQKMVSYATEQERIRREEERRRLEEAEAAKRAEQARLAEEAKAAMAAAESAIENGDMGAAEELANEALAIGQEAAVAAMTPVVIEASVVQVPKAKGVALVDNWTFEVTDFAALVRAAAARPELISLLATNDTAIRNMAKALKGAANIPGVRVYNNPTARVGR